MDLILLLHKRPSNNIVTPFFQFYDPLFLFLALPMFFVNSISKNSFGDVLFTIFSLFHLLYSSTSTMQHLEISRMQSLEISRFCILEIYRRCIVEVEE